MTLQRSSLDLRGANLDPEPNPYLNLNLNLNNGPDYEWI